MITTLPMPRVLRPFRHAAYRKLAVVLVATTFAYGMWFVAQVWEVIRLGGGPAQLSLVTMCNAIGLVVPALLAGVVADRVPQRTILLGCASLEALAMAGAAAMAWMGLSSIAVLSVAAALIGISGAFVYPAYSALLPALVPESDLLAVNGFEGTVRPVMAQAAGPALAGILVASFNPGAAAAGGAAASLIAVLALWVLPKTPLRREFTDAEHAAHPVRAAWNDLREGWAYMTRTPWLAATLLFACVMVMVVVGPIEVLVPFVIKDRLGGDAGDHAWVLAAFGLGGAGGSLAQGSLPMPRRYLSVMVLMWGLGCTPLIAMAYATALWQLVLAGLVLGALFSAPMVIWGTLLQRRVPPRLLGRVASLDFFVSIALMPVAMAAIGPVAELIGLHTTFVVAGGLPIVLAVLTIWWARMPADEYAHPLRD